MQFYSEDQTDRWVCDNLPLPERGVFVDVGAAHAFRYSQSAFLRQLGWTGLAIDANDDYRSEWADITGVHFVHAVVSNEPEVRFLYEPTNGLVSRKHETGALVQTQSLNAILERSMIGTVDFLCLDVEGMEFESLLSLDLHRYAPQIVVAEYRSEHAGEDFRVLHYLLAHGYRLVHGTHGNFTYKRI